MWVAVITGCVAVLLFVFLGLAYYYDGEVDGDRTKEVKRRDKDLSGFFLFLGGVCFVLLFIQAFMWPITYVSSMRRVADLEAFSAATFGAYEYTVDEAGDIDVYLPSGSAPDASWWEQREDAVDCLGGIRNKVEWYNGSLARNRRFNNNWFTGGYLADAPEDLQYIHLVVGD
jgi:hypothetical protein